jgi:hypothetical protein
MDWKDALAMSVLASQLLGSLEGNLNIGVRTLSEVCERTAGFSRIDGLDIAGIRERIKAETQPFRIRRWNTELALQRVLTDVGPGLGIDAFKYQEQILECFSAANSTWDELITRDFSFFFGAEGLSKVFARVSLLKNDRKMSETQALEHSASLLGWGAVSTD